MKTYRELLVWQKSMDFAESIYLATENFPARERYALAVQLRRAAVSVPSNVAEAQGRYSRGEARQFLLVARGSLLEAETQILLASRLRYVAPDTANTLIKDAEQLGKLLNGFLRYVQKQR